MQSWAGRLLLASRDLQSLPGNKAILVGDLKPAYTARQVSGGCGIKRLNELLAFENETGFVLFARVGGYNTDAGTHPLRSLTQHA